MIIIYDHKTFIVQAIEPKRRSTQLGSGLAHKYWTGLKRVARDKHSSLFFRGDSGEKKVLKH
jgi:hypothetical protein